MKSSFLGRRRSLLWLALKTGFFTTLTLGFYRFWMKTRMRRWYWSAIRPGGSPLEYTGTPYEKLLGFLIAVVFLAFYLGLVNLVLMFASFALLQTNVLAYLLSFIGVIPFYFYARYRARRFLLARTRWRGIRFGLEPGAWSYALRAFWHSLLTLLTLGLLLPRQTFKLEKFVTDRTYFGTMQMRQNGDWRMLTPALVPFALGVIMSVMTLLVAQFDPSTSRGGRLMAPPLGPLLVFVPLSIYGLVHYRVVTRRILANHKSLGPMSLESNAQPLRVAGYVFGGGFISLAILMVPLLLISLVVGLVTAPELFIRAFGDILSPEAIATIERLADIPRGVLLVVAVVAYLSLQLIYSALHEILVSLPIRRHYMSTLSIKGLGEAHTIAQRPKDEFAEAEGFAEALDVGAAL
ncbi:MAG: DUF898 family protein [Pseudomonadota bacterium]